MDQLLLLYSMTTLHFESCGTATCGKRPSLDKKVGIIIHIHRLIKNTGVHDLEGLPSFIKVSTFTATSCTISPPNPYCPVPGYCYTVSTISTSIARLRTGRSATTGSISTTILF